MTAELIITSFPPFEKKIEGQTIDSIIQSILSKDENLCLWTTHTFRQAQVRPHTFNILDP